MSSLQDQSLLRRRRFFAVGGSWDPSMPTAGGYTPDHWYRSDQGLWQDAGVTPAASDGDVVGRWEDITANADHVNQANAGNKPTLQSGAGDLVNGHPVVRGDGIDDYLQGAFTTGGAMNQPNTIIAVAKLDAAAVNDNNGHAICDGDDAGNRNILGVYQAAAPDKWQIYAGANLVGNNDDSDFRIWTAGFNGASSQLWHNGVSEAGPGNAGAMAIDGLTLFDGHAGGAPWKGDIAEIIMYDANLSDADKNQVGRYLAARYGLSYTDI